MTPTPSREDFTCAHKFWQSMCKKCVASALAEERKRVLESGATNAMEIALRDCLDMVDRSGDHETTNYLKLTLSAWEEFKAEGLEEK